MTEDSVDKDEIREATKNLLEAIGEDPEREELQETWRRRVPDSWEELTEGYREEEKPTMTTFTTDSQDMVIKTDITYYSLCAHHLIPFHGVAHIGYIPDEEKVGLSKLKRYTRWKSRQLHNQEELTAEIADGLMEEINARGVIVVLDESEHMCEQMRGVEANGTKTITSAIRGVFADPPEGKNPREEFMDIVMK